MVYNLVLELADDGQLAQEDQADNQQMEIIPLQTSSQYGHNTNLPHLLLNHRILTDIKQDEQTDEEQLILLPNQYIKFFELRLSTDPILLIIFPP